MIIGKDNALLVLGTVIVLAFLSLAVTHFSLGNLENFDAMFVADGTD